MRYRWKYKKDGSREVDRKHMRDLWKIIKRW